VTAATPPLELGPLERAAGMAFGRTKSVTALAKDHSRTPRQALEAVLVEALQRTPCVMSFSGGRDSSGLLAVAVAVARREGLPLPIPATLVFPDDEQADEGHWQQAVLDHLGLTERMIITASGDEFDAIGPLAREVLAKHGLLWPYNVHFHLPIVRQAVGGTVVTGFGGDELALSSSTLFAERVITRRRPKNVRDVLAVGASVSPWPTRFVGQLYATRQLIDVTPWLTPVGRTAVWAAYAGAQARSPLGWGRKLRNELWPARYVQSTLCSAQAIADPYDVRMTHPFVEPRVLQALAAHAPFTGMGGRDALVGSLFGDVLPPDVVRRTTKASFGSALWTETARDFARSWTGAGVDARFVDAEAIRRQWLDATVNAFSASLLQQGWLAVNRRPGGAH